jgi:uncharacterized linocin/CFP29 family protein
MIRPLLPLFGAQDGYVDSIVGHEVRPVQGVLRIRAGQSLVPVELSAAFQLSPEQFNDENAASALAKAAAYHVALAEDAVVLHGAKAALILHKLDVEQRNLDEQAGLMKEEKKVKVNESSYHVGLEEGTVAFGFGGEKAAATSEELDVEDRNLDEQAELLDTKEEEKEEREEQKQEEEKVKQESVLHAILRGIEMLQRNGHYGEYCVIVAPNLYRQAFEPRSSTLDAPIHQIRPLLKEGGFRPSWMAHPGTGVIFSLGGHTLDVAIPVDAKVELTEERAGVACLRVVEQFRLRVNDRTAVVQFRLPVKGGWLPVIGRDEVVAARC